MKWEVETERLTLEIKSDTMLGDRQFVCTILSINKTRTAYKDKALPVGRMLYWICIGQTVVCFFYRKLLVKQCEAREDGQRDAMEV